MKRLISAAAVCALLLGVAPVTAAQNPIAVDPALAAEIRAALQACRNEVGFRAKRDCQNAVKEQYEDEAPNLGHRIRRKAVQKARTELHEECANLEGQELNECRRTFHQQHPKASRSLLKVRNRHNLEEACGARNTSQQWRECAQVYHKSFLQQHPNAAKKFKVKHVIQTSRQKLEEACGTKADTDEWRDCARNQRDSFKEQHPEAAKKLHRRRLGNRISTEQRDQIRNCRSMDDTTMRWACLRQVRQSLRNSVTTE